MLPTPLTRNKTKKNVLRRLSKQIYCFLKPDPSEVICEEDKKGIVAFVAVESSRGNVFSHAVESKGSVDTACVTAFAAWLCELGWTNMAVRPDRERACVDLCKAAIAKARLNISIDDAVDQISQATSPEASSKSNGAVERANQSTGPVQNHQAGYST